MGKAIALILAASFLVATFFEWHARRRIKSIQQHEVTPEAIRYVSQHQQGEQ